MPVGSENPIHWIRDRQRFGDIVAHAILGGLDIRQHRSTGLRYADYVQATARTLSVEVAPVTLPPGRLRLATRPSVTGSLPLAKTIGTVVVAALAAGSPQTTTAAAVRGQEQQMRRVAQRQSSELQKDQSTRSDHGFSKQLSCRVGAERPPGSRNPVVLLNPIPSSFRAGGQGRKCFSESARGRRARCPPLASHGSLQRRCTARRRRAR